MGLFNWLFGKSGNKKEEVESDGPKYRPDFRIFHLTYRDDGLYTKIKSSMDYKNGLRWIEPANHEKLDLDSSCKSIFRYLYWYTSSSSDIPSLMYKAYLGLIIPKDGFIKDVRMTNFNKDDIFFLCREYLSEDIPNTNYKMVTYELTKSGFSMYDPDDSLSYWNNQEKKSSVGDSLRRGPHIERLIKEKEYRYRTFDIVFYLCLPESDVVDEIQSYTKEIFIRKAKEESENFLLKDTGEG